MVAAPSAAERRARTTVATDRPDRRFPLLIAVIAVLYLATGSWWSTYNVDTYTNVLQARSFAANGSATIAGNAHLTAPQYFGRTGLLVSTPAGGATSQYPPGVALWGAPFYLLDTGVTELDSTFVTYEGDVEPVHLLAPSFVPGTTAAIVATTLAMLFLGLTLRKRMSEEAMLACVAVAALGTGAWSVASDQLWQHSPGMMTIALGMYLASNDRFVGSGLAFAGAALIRPHTAIIAAAVGLTVGMRRRSLRPVIEMGSTSALGLFGVLVYNDAVFGEASISGGYGPTFSDRTLGGGTSWITLASRVGEALVHPGHGILASSPFFAVAFLALVGRTRRAPDWAVGGAIGALVYLLVQYKANRVSGGNVIFGYRYPLDPMMAAAPLLALATVDWVRTRPRAVVLAALVAFSVVAHGYGALFVGP